LHDRRTRQGDREHRIAGAHGDALDITQAATSLELERSTKIAVEKVSQVFPTDRCSVVLWTRQLTEAVVRWPPRERDDYHPITIDLSSIQNSGAPFRPGKPPTSRTPSRDPLMADVMPAIAPGQEHLVQPLISQG
jgi:hypothetical protein